MQEMVPPVPIESEMQINYEGIPLDFQCCITRELMTDPVYDKTQKGENIHYYERSVITHWISLHHTNPFTRASLTIDMLKADHFLKKRIDAFKAEHSRRLTFR